MTMRKPSRARAKADPAGARAGEGLAVPTQFVIFFVADEAFAVPLSSVKEIIRAPSLVHLPLSPASLQGLANLRGEVLPIVSTRRLFGLDDAPVDDATRVIILDHGKPLGIVVDRMANVVTVEPGKIESAEGIQTTVDSDILRGVIKDISGVALVMVLDTVLLLEADFSASELTTGAKRERGAADLERQTVQAVQEDVLQLVSFEVCGQEYALPIEHVQEIVQAPDEITRVPKADAAVLGVMNLRDRLLPVVSLRTLFGLEAGELGDHNRVVVVSLPNGLSVGVVMDRVKEVLRVARSVLDPMPSLLAQDDNLREIVSICRLEKGERLVSVLSAEAMFNAAQQELQAMASEDQPQARDIARGVSDEEQIVVFRLMEEEYGLAISAVQEIVRVPEQITHVPKTPSFVEGLVNLRGAVIPLVDQRSRFGLPRAAWSDRQRIMVLTIDGVRTGFIVDSVSEVMRVPRSAVDDAPALSEQQRRVIRRVANLPEHKRMILLLEAAQMLDDQETERLRQAA